MWLPDAYEGAPTPVTGFMATGIKAAAFGGMMRLLGDAFAQPEVAARTSPAGSHRRAAGASLTMTLGNLAAIRQDSVKRMLAYSSIAHAGYLLVGVAALGAGVTSARPALLFYLVAYTATTLGAFAVVAWVGRAGDEQAASTTGRASRAERPAVALAHDDLPAVAGRDPAHRRLLRQVLPVRGRGRASRA